MSPITKLGVGAIFLLALNAGVASAHNVATKCDSDGDDCQRIKCDYSGDHCYRIDYGYRRGDYDDEHYYRRSHYVCDSDGDRCYSSDGGYWNYREYYRRQGYRGHQHHYGDNDRDDYRRNDRDSDDYRNRDRDDGRDRDRDRDNDNY